MFPWLFSISFMQQVAGKLHFAKKRAFQRLRRKQIKGKKRNTKRTEFLTFPDPEKIQFFTFLDPFLLPLPLFAETTGWPMPRFFPDCKGLLKCPCFLRTSENSNFFVVTSFPFLYLHCRPSILWFMQTKKSRQIFLSQTSPTTWKGQGTKTLADNSMLFQWNTSRIYETCKGAHIIFQNSARAENCPKTTVQLTIKATKHQKAEWWRKRWENLSGNLRNSWYKSTSTSWQLRMWTLWSCNYRCHLHTVPVPAKTTKALGVRVLWMWTQRIQKLHLLQDHVPIGQRFNVFLCRFTYFLSMDLAWRTQRAWRRETRNRERSELGWFVPRSQYRQEESAPGHESFCWSSKLTNYFDATVKEMSKNMWKQAETNLHHTSNYVHFIVDQWKELQRILRKPVRLLMVMKPVNLQRMMALSNSVHHAIYVSICLQGANNENGRNVLFSPSFYESRNKQMLETLKKVVHRCRSRIKSLVTKSRRSNLMGDVTGHLQRTNQAVTLLADVCSFQIRVSVFSRVKEQRVN